MKLLNYMAAGLPVVAFKSGAKGIRHLHNGYLAADNDIQDYAQGIITFLQDDELREKMRQNARREIETYFWGKTVAEAESIYRQVALS